MIAIIIIQFAIIIFLIVKLVNQKKNMITLADFQVQLDSINASIVALTNSVGGLSPADTATALNGVTDAATKLAALVAPVVTTSPIVGNTSVAVGSTVTLSDAIPKGTWSSSDPSIASIDTSGVVTGNAAGTAVITYTFTDGTSVNISMTVA